MKVRTGMLALVVGTLFAATAAGCTAQTTPSQSGPDTNAGKSTSQDDRTFADDMSACLLEAGYEVETYEDGTIGIDLPEDQMPGYDRATSVCADDLGYSDLPQLTEDERRDLYQDTLSLVQCLEERGYEIEGVPSEQAFVDGTEFVPYEQVPTSVVGEEWQKLNQECPQP
jgi:hypothetical protein